MDKLRLGINANDEIQPDLKELHENLGSLSIVPQVTDWGIYYLFLHFLHFYFFISIVYFFKISIVYFFLISIVSFFLIYIV